MTVHSYLRVSSQQQAASGLGLEAQRASCERWAASQGVSVACWHVDEGLCGELPAAERPGLLDALNALGKGDVLLVAKLDRIARDSLVAIMIERQVERDGARLVSAAGEGTESDDPSYVFMRRILQAAAEYERELIRARTRAALAAKRARGEYTGGKVPFGQRLANDGKTLEVDGAFLAVSAYAQDLHAEGLSLREVGRRLAADGFPPPGSKWHAEQVKRLLALNL